MKQIKIKYLKIGSKFRLVENGTIYIKERGFNGQISSVDVSFYGEHGLPIGVPIPHTMVNPNQIVFVD